MISSLSQSLSKSQINYSVTDLELLAVVKAFNHYRHYLLGKEFTLRADHRTLTYIQKFSNQNSRLMRWSLKMQEFDLKTENIEGDENFADYFSRLNETKNDLDNTLLETD